MKIDVNNTTLFFDVYGSQLEITADNSITKPTLIILHGGHGFADHTLYVEFWSQFADIAQVIFLDQRGCGRSDLSSPDTWNLKHWADDLYLFCKLLHIDKPIIAGVSMGGHVMCEYIKHHPEHPGGLIFCNTEAQWPLDTICNKLRKIGTEQAAQIFHEFYTNPSLANFEKFGQYCVPYYGHNAYSKTELSRCKKNPEVFIHYCENEMLKFDYLDQMHKIQCPTLLLVGEDSLHVVEAAEVMANNIDKKYLTMDIFENCGAPVYKDQPKESFNSVNRFLSANFL